MITGRYNPAGRTPVDVPRSVGHIPVYHCQYNGSTVSRNRRAVQSGYIDAKDSVLVPFGYGLSYTAFAYSDFMITLDQNTGAMSASVVVENIGRMDGDEVVQLYGSDLLASMLRPVHKLAVFKRVSMKAGEKKKVIFRFNIDFFAFLDQHMKWILEKGDFRFTVGSHSDDIRSEQTVRLSANKEVDYKMRCLYAEAIVQ